MGTIAVPARGQTAAPTDAAPAVPPGSSLSAELLEDLPGSDNSFAIIETTQAEVTADRFNGGGLNVGRPARIGAFLSSWTQTQFRLDGVNITSPDGTGTPMLFPTLAVWDRIDVTTGLPFETRAPGLSVSFEPRRPASEWTRTAEGWFSAPPLIAEPGTGPPAISRLDRSGHASVVASGPLVPGRAGIVVAGEWNRSSQFDRGSSDSNVGEVGSAFAHLVFTTRPDEELRTIVWLERTRAPFADVLASQSAIATSTDAASHVQATWERHRAGRTSWRLSGAYTRHSSTRDLTTNAPIVEQLVDLPIPELADTGNRTLQRWSLGAEARAKRTAGATTHALVGAVEVAGITMRVEPGFTGTIDELVNGVPARVWSYTTSGVDARRHSTSIIASANDRVGIGRRIVVDASLAYDGTNGSADGATTSVGWHTLLPRAAIRWEVADVAHVAVVGGYRRSADQLTLNLLAFGDPAAPTAIVSRLIPGAQGAIIARVGPGTGGDATFSAIDPGLERPITDELVAAIEARPLPAVRMRFGGIVKRQSHLSEVVDVGAPAADYSTIFITDHAPGGDVILPVYNRLPASFGKDRYLLTNPPQNAATSSGLVFSLDASTSRLRLLFGATASQTDAPAAWRGFRSDENDTAIPGELFVDPNAATNARGRLFIDRAYTVKLASVYRFPHDVTLGLVARYQDGQPFSRMIAIDDLNQGPEAIRAFAPGDSRFTYTGTLDVRAQKAFAAGRSRVAAVVDAYNIVNMGNEVEERVATGPGFRAVTAVQPPLAVRVGLRVSF